MGKINIFSRMCTYRTQRHACQELDSHEDKSRTRKDGASVL